MRDTLSAMKKFALASALSLAIAALGSSPAFGQSAGAATVAFSPAILKDGAALSRFLEQTPAAADRMPLYRALPKAGLLPSQPLETALRALRDDLRRLGPAQVDELAQPYADAIAKRYRWALDPGYNYVDLLASLAGAFLSVGGDKARNAAAAMAESLSDEAAVPIDPAAAVRLLDCLERKALVPGFSTARALLVGALAWPSRGLSEDEAFAYRALARRLARSSGDRALVSDAFRRLFLDPYTRDCYDEDGDETLVRRDGPVSLNARFLSRGLGGDISAEDCWVILPAAARIVMTPGDPSFARSDYRDEGDRAALKGAAVELERVAASSDRRVAWAARYLGKLGGLELAVAGAPSLEAVAAEKDDEAAFWEFRFLAEAEPAAVAGAKPAALLALAAGDRPTLSAAVLAAGAAAATSWGAADREALVALAARHAASGKEGLVLAGIHVLRALERRDKINVILALSGSPLFWVRRAAASSMAFFAGPECVPALVSLLGDARQDIRIAAAETLGAIKDARAADRLASILSQKDESPAMRVACARALGRIGDRRLVEIGYGILALPPDGSGVMTALRIQAANALGQAREERAIDALAGNVDPTRRNALNAACLEALGRVGSERAAARVAELVAKAGANWAVDPAGASKGQLERGLVDRFQNLEYALWAASKWRSEAMLTAARELWKPPDGKAPAYLLRSWLAAYYLALHDGLADGKSIEYLREHAGSAVSSPLYDLVPESCATYPDGSLAMALLGRLPEAGYSGGLWALSALCRRPRLDYLPSLPAVLAQDDDEDWRYWSLHLAAAVLALYPKGGAATAAQAEGAAALKDALGKIDPASLRRNARAYYDEILGMDAMR